MKSVARLVGPDESVRECGDGWITERVRSTCQLPGNNATAHVLGVDVGSNRVRDEQFASVSKVVAAGREHIGNIGDAATELVLPRRCADVCKVTHLLRAHGRAVQPATLKEFDDNLDRALTLATGGPPHGEALAQAGRKSSRAASALARLAMWFCVHSLLRGCKHDRLWREAAAKAAGTAPEESSRLELLRRTRCREETNRPC